MKINVADLPSKGFGYSIQTLELNPLGYKKLIEYSHSNRSNQTEVVLSDIEYLIKDIPNWEEISLYDYKAILCSRKLITVTPTNTIKLLPVTCPKCQKQFSNIIDRNSITFPPITDDIKNIQSVVLGGETYTVNVKAKVKDLYDTITLFKSRNVDFDLEVAMTATILGFVAKPNEIHNLLESASYTDVTTLHTLSEMLSGNALPMEMVHDGCGGTIKVQLNELIVNLFRTTIYNNQPSGKEIIIRKGI